MNNNRLFYWERKDSSYIYLFITYLFIVFIEYFNHFHLRQTYWHYMFWKIYTRRHYYILLYIHTHYLYLYYYCFIYETALETGIMIIITDYLFIWYWIFIIIFIYDETLYTLFISFHLFTLLRDIIESRHYHTYHLNTIIILYLYAMKVQHNIHAVFMFIIFIYFIILIIIHTSHLIQSSCHHHHCLVSLFLYFIIIKWIQLHLLVH